MNKKLFNISRRFSINEKIIRLFLKLSLKIDPIHRPHFVTKKSECLYQNQINQVSSNNCKSLRLRILTYPWHIPHQYELYKLGYHFTLIVDAGSWHTTGWNFDLRPIPPNIEFKSIRDINVRDYDLAILHFDENVLSPQNCYSQVDLDWGKTFKYFREKIDLPKIAICHGTHQFYGQCNLNYKGSNLLEIIEPECLKLVDYLDSILVITNSYQAQSEWQFKNSKVVWHGFDPDEFPLTTYAKGILSPYGQAVISRPHYRGYHIYHDVIKRLPPDSQPSTLSVKIPDNYTSANHYAQLKFQNYVNNIRKYSIYFNPTVRSPMPRSRGEAMMCGLVTVSLKNHDVDKFVENGVNGFYADTAKELAEILCYLMEHPEETRNIGLKSRELAIKTFHIDRFLNDWKTIIEKTLGISIDDL